MVDAATSVVSVTTCVQCGKRQAASESQGTWRGRVRGCARAHDLSAHLQGGLGGGGRVAVCPLSRFQKFPIPLFAAAATAAAACVVSRPPNGCSRSRAFALLDMLNPILHVVHVVGRR